jgi:GDP-D-mannose dehydratase
MSRRALIATGQDGSYLVELLLARDYQVHAQSRRTDSTSLNNIATCIGIPQIFVIH